MSAEKEFDWAYLAKSVEGLDRQAKISVLAQVAHELTVLARDTYEPGTRLVSDPSRLRATNEVLHRLTRRLLTLSRGKEDDWKETDYWQALREIAEGGGCLVELVSAVSTARTLQEAPQKPC